jgi:hypothetical protein
MTWRLKRPTTLKNSFRALQSLGSALAATLILVALGAIGLGAHPRLTAFQPAATSPTPTASSISSISFIQVYSSFMWGRAHLGGLDVQLTLLDSTGTVTVGVPEQTVACNYSIATNCVQVDRVSLYFETVFVDPNSHSPVIILPGEQVQVVTSGIDQSQQAAGVQTTTQAITVDDVEAWTSYQNGTVSGTTSLPNAPVVITIAQSFLSLSAYLAISGVTYAQVTADAHGNFSAAKFQNGTSGPLAAVTLQQGSTGFVRVQHPDQNEVYTVHGQNIFVLENSNVAHGYAFSLPSAPTGLGTDFKLTPRPPPTVSVTLQNAHGGTLDVETPTGSSIPYTVRFTQSIVGGDVVLVSINQSPPVASKTVTTSPLTAGVDLAHNQVTGSGPPSTSLTVGIGRIDGYISSSSSFTYVQQQVTSSGSGQFSSGAFSCGTNSQLLLQPGSFGYVGYEDSHGNFTYEDFAAPRADVMANYAFVEGWVSDGTVRPTVTVADSRGNLIAQTSNVAPQVLYLVLQKLYLNVYYNVTPSQFIAPGDTVTVTVGGQTATIPVDNLTAAVDTDTNSVIGTAPVGATVKVIPATLRTSFQTATTNSGGSYNAPSPFTNLSDVNCSASSFPETFTPGATGRAYLTHPDGNQVFVTWGRSLHLNEDENVVDLYEFPAQNLDWNGTLPPLTVPATVTLTSPTGSTAVGYSSARPANCPLPSLNDTPVCLLDAQNQKALIQAGDTITATFAEGPVGGPSRLVSLTVASLPLVTGSPEVGSNTLAGIGPASWAGRAQLTTRTNATPATIAARSSTAYPPITFRDATAKPIALAFGDAGTVSFTDPNGNRVWSAWAVTSFSLAITSRPRPGDTRVCGTATPNVTVSILDVTTQPTETILGSGPADSQGSFCVPVSPPLVASQVLIAQDNSGTRSQPVIVQLPIFLPLVQH